MLLSANLSIISNSYVTLSFFKFIDESSGLSRHVATPFSSNT
jgi:hypothetical protein